MSDKTCKHCRHFSALTGVGGFYPGFGSCSRWHTGYRKIEGIKSNEVHIEDDEGWGAEVGPDFGCVLWEERETGK